ncbi:MAG: methionyl-tRNA formyltransferase [Proteobacteria bacterium]|nr:methionyl-tRNA formyltransferase [Pseudomonadota bacterium]
MTRLRLAFMGTPEFAVPTLKALLAAGHLIGAVYTQPPRPAGRGYQPQPSPVQVFAEAHGLTVLVPASLRGDEAVQAEFSALGLDAVVVVAYGLMLPKRMLAAPRLGCLNVHASLLPRWRGAAPIQRAILAGDRRTGVSIMLMDEGLDTGPVVLARMVPITLKTTAEGLHDELARLGADLVLEALDGLAAGRLDPRPQPSEGVTYAPKLDRDEGRIEWAKPAATLERMVRALNPWPGVWFSHQGEAIKVLAAELAGRPAGAQPGTVLDERLTVACGEGALRLLKVQRAGRQALSAGEFLRGRPLAPGTMLG